MVAHRGGLCPTGDGVMERRAGESETGPSASSDVNTESSDQASQVDLHVLIVALGYLAQDRAIRRPQRSRWQLSSSTPDLKFSGGAPGK